MIFAKSLLLNGERSAATEVLDRMFEQEIVCLGPAKTQTLKKSYALNKTSDGLLDFVKSTEKEVEYADPWWNPYLPLTVPE